MEYPKYIYSVARVRVLESRLIRKDVLSNIAAARSADEALRLIEQTGSYSMDILNIRNSQDLEVFSSAELTRLDRLAKELFVDGDLYKAFTLFGEDLAASYALIEKSRHDFLKAFFKKAIDLANIKIFLRLHYRKAPNDDFKSQLIGGGCLGKEYFLDFLEKSLQELRDALMKSPYGAFAARVDFTDLDFAVLEREADNYLINFIKRAKYLSFGPEPLFGYLMAKSSEIRAVRMIMMSKFNVIEPGFIAKRMVENYA